MFYITFEHKSNIGHTLRNKQIIRTRLPLGRFGSDYIALVPLTGLEPVQSRLWQILSLLCLPIPP